MEPPIKIQKDRITTYWDPMYAQSLLTIQLHLRLEKDFNDFVSHTKEGLLEFNQHSGFVRLFGDVVGEPWQAVLKSLEVQFKEARQQEGRVAHLSYMCSVGLIIRGLYHFWQDYLLVSPAFCVALPRITSMNLAFELQANFTRHLGHQGFPLTVVGEVSSVLSGTNNEKKWPYRFNLNLVRPGIGELRNKVIRKECADYLVRSDPYQFNIRIGEDDLFNNLIRFNFDNLVQERRTGYTLDDLYRQMDRKKTMVFSSRKEDVCS